jgi:hypothetical protein
MTVSGSQCWASGPPKLELARKAKCSEFFSSVAGFRQSLRDLYHETDFVAEAEPGPAWPAQRSAEVTLGRARPPVTPGTRPIRGARLRVGVARRSGACGPATE